MKNSKFVKILAFIAAVVLTVGVTFAFGVSAEVDATDEDLAVAGKNIVYGDTLTIQYAVSTSNVSASAKLFVANSEGALGSTGYTKIETTDKITGTEDSYYVFEVSGIPASDVCEEIIVHIEDGEKVGPEMKYSLAEYFFERLYSDGIVNAAEGKARKEEVDTHNMADQTIYQTEKTLNELGDKISASEKSEIQAAIDNLKEVNKGNDVAAIKAATEAVQQAFYKVSEKLYQQAGPQGGAQGGYQAPNDGPIDADYETVD